jgi:phosphonate transport system ATP-binding protein
MEIRLTDVVLEHVGGVRALDGVSLEIPEGQACVVLGLSGAGKSSLLRTVVGLEVPTHGQLALNGSVVNRQRSRALASRIGMVHQDFALVARASVAANIASGALPAMPLWRALLGRYRLNDRARVVALHRAVGLDEALLHRRVSSLSGGQQQRVGVARACMLAPSILIADEPVASLDPQTSIEIMALLCDRARAVGATLLCSVHQVELAKRFADRIIGLRAGRIVFDGPPEQLDADALAAIFGSPRLSTDATPVKAAA